MEDHHQRLWIGMEGNFFMLDADRKIKFSFQNDPHDSTSISSSKIEATLLDDITHDIWIGTWDGLNRMILPQNGPITKENIKFVSFKHANGNLNSLSINSIISLCKSKSGILWAGTNGGGFNKIVFSNLKDYKKTSYSFKRYTEENGLCNNVVYGIVEDKSGKLWLSTNKGISNFDPETEIFTNYFTNDGLQSNEFYWRSFYHGPSDKIYFGGIKGYNVFYADSIKKNNYKPPIEITGFSIFNKLQVLGTPGCVLKKLIGETKEITISYNQSVISFDYIALNFIGSYRNRYAYKMEGFDKEWLFAGNQTKATYTNLDPGEYTFRVKGSNNDDIWNETGASIVLIVKPPFWKTFWFRFLLICFVIAVVFSIYFYRIRTFNKQNKLLQRLVNERTAEIEQKNLVLSDQANALISTNSLLDERRQYIEEQAEELTSQRDELKFLNSTKDKLFSILAHDLRNPFHVIMGFSSLMLSDFNTLSQERIKKYLGLIQSSSVNGNDLLENLLQWSRAQTGRMSYEPEECNLASIAGDVEKLMEGDVHRKSLTIQQTINSSIVVMADPNMLKTIFRNLLSNAIKFTPENGTVTLKTEVTSQAGYIAVVVADTGVGISEETQKKLFYVESTISTRGTAQEVGTGLGLIICKEFVEKHKGKIWIVSQEKQGSAFKFTLPVKNLREL